VQEAFGEEEMTGAGWDTVDTVRGWCSMLDGAEIVRGV
jgi:hypothetical protein